MQGHSCRTTYRLLHGEDRCEARMSFVTVPIPARHRLDHEKDDIKQKSSGYLRASCLTLMLQVTLLSCPTVTNECRKKLLNTARTQHQQKQEKDYESQHKEQQPHYIERRATGRDRLIHVHTWAVQSTKMEAQKISKQII